MMFPQCFKSSLMLIFSASFGGLKRPSTNKTSFEKEDEYSVDYYSYSLILLLFFFLKAVLNCKMGWNLQQRHHDLNSLRVGVLAVAIFETIEYAAFHVMYTDYWNVYPYFIISH
ncbi:hypothetical protein L5515_004651 [Caenorhabditis briggsae]|uniref:Uncharacterized protein n=1 Tax=Caenorhabditis briggsae TaxID=6238 RepID=A0AAE9EN62_CAEBR|nr:hypothetical protein L3Y34_001810 [Caenorhabditis briggsae]UMM24389.1 hypothetical protein L5515_004651 [Caenorhabditis briggsae]